MWLGTFYQWGILILLLLCLYYDWKLNLSSSQNSPVLVVLPILPATDYWQISILLNPYNCQQLSLQYFPVLGTESLPSSSPPSPLLNSSCEDEQLCSTHHPTMLHSGLLQLWLKEEVRKVMQKNQIPQQCKGTPKISATTTSYTYQCSSFNIIRTILAPSREAFS